MEGPSQGAASSSVTAPAADEDERPAAAACRRNSNSSDAAEATMAHATRLMAQALAPPPSSFYDPTRPPSSTTRGYRRGGASKREKGRAGSRRHTVVPGQAITTTGGRAAATPGSLPRGNSPVPPRTTLTGKSTPASMPGACWDSSSLMRYTHVFGAGPTTAPGTFSSLPPFAATAFLPPTATSFLHPTIPLPPHQQAMMPPTKKRRSSSSKQRGSARGAAQGGVQAAGTVKQGSSKASSNKRRGSTTTTAEVKAQQKQRKTPITVIQDENPTRIVNPLLELPLFPTGDHPPPEYIPNGAEMYNWTDLYLCQPDTFPISYYARLLGFQVPSTAAMNEPSYVALDPQQVPLVTDHVWTSIPKEGRFAQQVWKKTDDERMDYMDPMYRAIWKNGYDPSHLSPATNVPGIPRISHECLMCAKEQQLLDEDWTFTFAATAEDQQELQTKWPRLSSNVASSSPSEFVIVARYKSIPKGYIHYKFQWYRFEDDDTASSATAAAETTPGAYGMSSAAASLRKPKVSELIFTINRVECCSQQEQAATKEAPMDTGKAGVAGGQHESDTTDLDDPTALILVALALEHARGCDIWYGIQQIAEMSNVAWFTTYFRMATLPRRQQDVSCDDVVHLVCDLKKCSYRYAFLLKREHDDSHNNNSGSPLLSAKEESTPSIIRERMLVRLPTVDEAKAAMEPAAAIPSQRSPRSKSQRKASLFFTGANEKMRSISFGIRAYLPTPESPPLQLYSLAENKREQGSNLLTTSSSCASDPRWDVLRIFPMVPASSNDSDKRPETQHDNDILHTLSKKQKELGEMENGFEPKLRSLLAKVIDERMAYESLESVKKRETKKKILKDYEAVLERRREMDRAWQKQLEQDMDAVCDICNDGEVTPDNQILFCEACNVAIHQFCYGIGKVPEGDYYCLACRFFQREKMSQVVARQQERGVTVTATALPICCELCPRKQGAFIRTDTSNQKAEDGTAGLSKWVHVVCAKWQGLNFVSPTQKDVVEDVTELKRNFRYLVPRPKCVLCLGNRGAFNNCHDPDCKKWLHVTCARATGLCKVRHGENAVGALETNPWTLYCPEHSDVDPDAAVSKGCVTIEELVRAAKEFPTEPDPVLPKPRPPKFYKMTGKDRRKFLADPEYEQKLLAELMLNKSQGVFCEVCQSCEQDGVNLTRCVGCRVVFCVCCKLDVDGANGQNYKCAPCRFVEKKTKAGETFEEPHCHMCFQRGGWMRRGFANPVNKKTYWKNNPKEFEKTMFVKDLWCHALCTLWQSKYIQPNHAAEVDCSGIIMSNGTSHILGNHRCALCWQTGGMKVQCDEEGCRAWGEKRGPFYFHATCARQAGLEVKDKPDGSSYLLYAKCFRHSGNGFAFRARLEDLIEIEKKRAGKFLTRIDQTMNLAHASRLFNAACLVMSQLGWAWRWAEWWVEYGDNWEPFLEPDEKEDEMTPEQLRIVESTRESRRADARKCRLTALSAALRNREYDAEEGDDKVALDRALRSVLHAKSLVGPLEKYEIDFFAEWLGRAYRSKSRLLGFGDDKIPVANTGRCVHIDGGSPKFELGSRPLPGRYDLANGEVFESVMEVDDFLQPETLQDGTLVTEEILKPARKKRACTSDETGVPARKKPRKRKRQKLDLIDEPVSPLSASATKKSRKHTESNIIAGGKTDSAGVVRQMVSPTNAPKKRGRPGRPKKIHSASKHDPNPMGKAARCRVPLAQPTSRSPKNEVIQRKRRGRPPKSKPALPPAEVVSEGAVRMGTLAEFDEEDSAPLSTLSKRIPKKRDLRAGDAQSGGAGPREDLLASQSNDEETEDKTPEEKLQAADSPSQRGRRRGLIAAAKSLG